MSVTEKHVYNVEGFGHWLAKDAAQARRAALLNVTAKRLTGGEIIALPPGSINDAETTLAGAGDALRAYNGETVTFVVADSE